MVFNNFRINIIVRIIFMVFVMMGFVFAISQDEWYMTLGALAILEIVLIIELIKYVESANKKHSNFLEAIKNHDFSSDFSKGIKGKSFNKLNSQYDTIINEFRNLRNKEEIQFQYLKMLINNLDVSVISFDSRKKIELINKAAEKLFGKRIKNLEEIKNIEKSFYDVIKTIKPGERKLYKYHWQSDVLQLAIVCSGFKIEQEQYLLISFQNIKDELENNELDSWQKLIRILTHEIMNSVTPIVSLSSAMREILFDEEKMQISQENISADDMNDIYSSVESIERRSTGMLKFINAYKDLTRIPKPEMQGFFIDDLFNDVSHIYKNKCIELNVDFQISASGKMELIADKDQVEQILVNLINNSIEALEETKYPIIKLNAFQNEPGNTIVEIMDNGSGISKENIDKVFIPFYTSKKDKGSGIGLALSRQIMRMHAGNISVQSTPHEKTVFSLKF